MEESVIELLMLIMSVVDNGLPFFCQITSIPACPAKAHVRLNVFPLLTTMFSIPFLMIGTEPANHANH